MIQEAVKDDVHLQQELVVQVSIFGDLSEALHWAQFYSIPQENWPTAVRHLYDNPDRTTRFENEIPVPHNNEIEFDNSNLEVTYHQFPLQFNNIKVIDTPESFENFMDYGLTVIIKYTECFFIVGHSIYLRYVSIGPFKRSGR